MENKRKTREELEGEIFDLEISRNNLRCLLTLAIIIAISFIVASLYLSLSKTHAIKVLDLEDELSIYQVLKHYPEFENCTIEYSSCISSSCGKGVKIYCNLDEELGVRDGLVPTDLKEKSPDEILAFKGIKLKDIYKDWKGYRINGEVLYFKYGE